MIVIAADHAAIELKAEMVRVLESRAEPHRDLGTHEPASVDYPDYAHRLVDEILGGRADRGVLICGTGIGMSITANRVSGVRAALCHDNFTARMSREHNDANLLVLGGRVLGVEVALDMVATWLTTAFGGDRHQRRLDQIENPPSS